VLGQAVEDYVKSIYKLQQEHGRVPTSAVAQRMNVSDASATNMIKRLAELGLARHHPYRGVELSEAGMKVALEVIRHHRLIELYLKEALGYTWDQVDAEAEHLEHHISEEFEDRIDAALGFPTVDPHGDPIPAKDGTVDHARFPRLTDLAPGVPAIVRRVSDRDAEVLRYLAQLGLYPGVRVVVRERAPFDGPLFVRVGDTEHVIGHNLAATIGVEVASPTE
jgi:DtxR family Mn-dependent transcriptional regulator